MNTPIELEIQTLVFGGRGLARLDGLVYFVEGALPGERVQAEVLRRSRNFAECRAVRILVPSPERVSPPCPYFGACNGCQYQHLLYTAQVREKRRQIEDALQHLGLVQARVNDFFDCAEKPFGYRNSLTFHLARDGSSLCFTRGDGAPLPVEGCLLGLQAVNTAARAALADLLHDGEIKKFPPRACLTVKTGTDGRTALVLTNEGRVLAEDGAELSFPCGGLSVVFNARTFFQTNFLMLEKLISLLDSRLAGAVGPGSVLFDVYAGVGTFSCALGKYFEKTALIEENPESVRCARKNLAGQNCRIAEGRSQKRFNSVFSREKGSHNTVFLNPPRTGCDPDLLRSLLFRRAEIRSLYYLCCEPSILARDLKKLLAPGAFRLEGLWGFDMFPQTRHIETLVHLVPA